MSAFRARRRLRSPPTARQRPAVRKPIPWRSRSTSASLARRRLRKPRTARRRPVGSSPIRWRTRGTSAFLARPSSRGFESLCRLLNRPKSSGVARNRGARTFSACPMLGELLPPLLAPWSWDSQWLGAAFDRLDRERHALQRRRIVASNQLTLLGSAATSSSRSGPETSPESARLWANEQDRMAMSYRPQMHSK
jgi:hypothetical protein